MNREEIRQLAKLARISVSEEEIRAYEEDFERILRYVEKIQELQLPEGGEVEREEFLNVNVVREDEDSIPAGTYHEKLVSAAPRSRDGYIQVKKVL